MGHKMARRKYKRMDKATRANAKLWAEGCREEILAPHVALYADALSRSWVAERDYLLLVQNEYHQLISWRLPDDEEPALPLPVYNLSGVSPVEILTDEEQQLKSKTIGQKNKVREAVHSFFTPVLTLLTLSGNSALVEIPRPQAH